jgi:hypothetical protein
MEAAGGELLTVGKRADAGILSSVRSAWAAFRERRSLPRIPPPRRAEPAVVARSALASAWQARTAVRSGARVEDFLRFRLARYAAALSVPASELPVEIGIEGGEPVVRGRTRPPAEDAVRMASYRDARAEEARFTRALVALEGPIAAREIREAGAELEALDARAAAEQARLDALARALEDDLAAGRVPAAPHVDATAEQLGRPRVPPAWPVAGVYAFAAGLVVAVAWRLALPFLGIPGTIGAVAEAARDDLLGVALGLALAVGDAVSLFVLAGLAVDRIQALSRDEAPSSPRRRRWTIAAGAGAAALAAALAIAGADLGPDPAPMAVLLLVLPFATAMLLRFGARLAARRSAALEEALDWDRLHVRETAERARRTEAIAWASEAVRRTAAARDAAAQRLRALQARAIAAQRTRDEEALAEERRLERLADALAAALELDRYAFVRRASARARPGDTVPALRPRREPAVAMAPVPAETVPLGVPVASAMSSAPGLS